MFDTFFLREWKALYIILWVGSGGGRGRGHPSGSSLRNIPVMHHTFRRNSCKCTHLVHSSSIWACLSNSAWRQQSVNCCVNQAGWLNFVVSPDWCSFDFWRSTSTNLHRCCTKCRSVVSLEICLFESTSLEFGCWKAGECLWPQDKGHCNQQVIFRWTYRHSLIRSMRHAQSEEYDKLTC